MIIEKSIKFEVASCDLPKLLNWSDAMKAASEYREGGYADWRLPTAEELDFIYKNKNEISGLNLTGSFPDGWYWSSSPDDYGVGCAQCQRLSDGLQYIAHRRLRLSVRPVRS